MSGQAQGSQGSTSVFQGESIFQTLLGNQPCFSHYSNQDSLTNAKLMEINFKKENVILHKFPSTIFPCLLFGVFNFFDFCYARIESASFT